MKLISKFEKTNKNYFYKLNTSKHFPSSVRQWDNVIYVYNKDTLKVIPNVAKYVISLIKGYFTLYNKKLEKKIRLINISNKKRRYSSNKFYLSNGEFKHTNNKVIITLYLFNRQKNNFFSRLNKVYLNKIYQKKKYLKKIISKNKSITKLDLKKILLKRMNIINLRVLSKLNFINKKEIHIVRILKTIKNKNNNLKNYKAISDYINRFYKKLIKRNIRKIEKYVYYKQLIYINKSKLNYTYLQYLKNYLQYFFNKNVEFNFVNLKKFYYNSDILSEAMLLKITRNRNRLLGKLNRLTDKINIRRKKYFVLKKPETLQSKKNFNQNSSLLINYIVNKLKYKHVTGFRLQAKGRLTRRYTASRSLCKFKYKGNLWNIDSSIRGLSTVILKGNMKSNLQFTKMNSKTRIGSFGLKGWVSGN